MAVAHDAIADARSICMRQYGDSPEVEVFGDANFTFAYVPGHLHQMLFELVGEVPLVPDLTPLLLHLLLFLLLLF